MDKTSCPCLAERSPSVRLHLYDLVAQDGPFPIDPTRADWRQILCKQDRIDFHKAREWSLNGDPKRDDGGHDDSEHYGRSDDPESFAGGWAKSEEEEKHSNPFWKSVQTDVKTENRINARRASIAEHILKLEDGVLAGLSHEDAIARYKAVGMLKAYYRFDTCLQCPKWLERSETDDARADALLHHLVALFGSLGEPVPVGLRNWARAAPLIDRKRPPGRPKKYWRRDQKIALAVDILVKLTHSSVGDAENIVLEVCRKNRIVHMELESMRKTRDRVKQEAKQVGTAHHLP